MESLLGQWNDELGGYVSILGRDFWNFHQHARTALESTRLAPNDYRGLFSSDIRRPECEFSLHFGSELRMRGALPLRQFVPKARCA